jgi:hypothetical protein
MTAAVYNITVEQGATYSLTVNVNGLNLTGGSARMQCRRSYNDDLAVVDLDTGSKGGLTLTVTDSSNATIDVEIAPSQTAALLQNLRYDLEVVQSDGTVHRLMQGAVRLSKEITR